MTFYTEKFQLTFFSRGEAYSASQDKQRFESIDQELSALSSLIGSGVVSGMSVSKHETRKVKVDEGIFCIDGRMYFNSISQYIYLDTLGVNYLWAITGTSSSLLYGNNSNIASIDYTDITAGYPVSDVIFNASSPYKVKIKIKSKVQGDIYKIRIYRAIINEFSQALPLSVMSYPDFSYDDDSVNAGGYYYYWFINEDVNGFNSDVSDSFFYQSPIDFSTPDFPTRIQIYPAHRSICVNWSLSISKNVNYYYITCSQSDVIQSAQTPNNVGHIVFNNLTNGIPVSVSVRAVSFFEIESEVVQLSSIPKFHPGPRDFDYVLGSFSPSSVEGASISYLKVMWNDPNIDPYLPDLSLGEIQELSEDFDIVVKYIVFEVINIGTLSIQGEPTVAFFPNELLFSSFNVRGTNNNIIVKPLKDNCQYLIKIYRLINGMESNGRFINVITGDITPPPPPSNFITQLGTSGSLESRWTIDNILEVHRQKLVISSAIILSTTYEFDFNHYINGISFQTNSSEVTNLLFYLDNFIINIGYVDGYFIFEVNKDIVSEINSSQEIIKIEDISPSGGLYIGVSNLSLDDFIVYFSLAEPVIKIYLNVGNVEDSTVVKMSELLDIVNMSGLDNKSLYFTNFIPTSVHKLTDFDASGRKEKTFLYSLSGIQNINIPKTVVVGDFVLDVSEDLLKDTSYSLDQIHIKENRRYKFSLRSYDFGNNVSNELVSFYDTSSLSLVSPPLPPSMQMVSIEDDLLKVFWIPSSSEGVTGYRILRSLEYSSNNMNQLGWIVVGEVGSNIHDFLDYSAKPGFSYIYRVISVGLLGKVSPSFFSINNNNSTTSISRVPSIVEGSFLPLINVLRQENDAIISFENQDGSYDGFHIFRSFNNNQFEKIASVATGLSFFTDSNVFIKTGLYRYIVRPVTTQASIFVTSDSSYENGALLASVVVSSSDMTITDLSRNVLLASSVISPELSNRIGVHRHLLFDPNLDTRINMEDEYIFSNFQTDDNKSFFINEFIPLLPENYSVSVLVNDLISDIPYTFNPNRNILIFSSEVVGVTEVPVIQDGIILNPYVAPIIKLIINISGETKGELSKDRVSSIFAQQIGSGKLSKKMIPNLSHSGLLGEKLVPLNCLAESVDGFKHMVTLNEYKKYLTFNRTTGDTAEISEFEFNDINADGINIIKVGFPLNKTRHYLVYDAFNIPGTENFIFCTSRGVYYYWQSAYGFIMDLLISSEPPQDSGPCHRVVYLAELKLIICLNFRSFDILRVNENGGVYLAYAQQAFEFNAHVFRDATETSDGSMFVTSDIGIFRIRFSSLPNYNQFGDVSNIKIDQLGLFSGSSTEVYATWTSKDKKIIYISTDFGVFYSVDFGDTFVTNMNLKRSPVFSSVLDYQGTLFGVSLHGLYRKRENENSFVRIYYDSLIEFKRIIVKYGKILLTTSDGLYKTESIVKCKYNDKVEITHINVSNASNGKRKFVYSIVYFGSYLVACLEGKTVIMYNIDRYYDHINFSNNITIYGEDDFPTVLVDGKVSQVGVFFQYTENGIMNDCIFFDYFIPESSIVRVMRQYSKSALPTGGWARRDFAASCILYKNNIKLNDGSRAEKPFNQVAYYSELQHSLDDTVSNLSSLELSLVDLRKHAAFMLVNKLNTSGEITEIGIHKFTRNNIRKLIGKIDALNSKIYDDDDVSKLGILSSLRVPYISINVDFLSNVFDPKYGVSLQKLDSLGISYQPYVESDIEGSLGTYDLEDSAYYIPSVLRRANYDGIDAPNYSYEDSDSFSEDINVPYSGYYGSNQSQSPTFSFVGRNPHGVIPDNPSNPGTGPGGSSGPSGPGGPT